MIRTTTVRTALLPLQKHGGGGINKNPLVQSIDQKWAKSLLLFCTDSYTTHLILLLKLGVDPVTEDGDASVHTGISVLGAVFAPGSESDKDAVGHHRTAGVSVTKVKLALEGSGTEHLAGHLNAKVSVHLSALGQVHHWHVHCLQNRRKRSVGL